jgi:hypothetical protein
MPDVAGLILRSNPRVVATGRLIKGLYYSDSVSGAHTLAAFFIACDRLLEPRPFLMMDFRTNQFSFDGGRDGCADATGHMPLPEIDPADFLSSVDQAEDICDEEAISQRWSNELVAVREPAYRRSITNAAMTGLLDS